MPMLAWIVMQSQYTRKYYVPRTPRQPMVLVWPSVMNPAVPRAPAQDKESAYSRIECDKGMRASLMQFNLIEVQCKLVWMDGIHTGLKFWDKMVPRLIDWLSAEVIECGIYTVYRNSLKMRNEIYRLIKENRDNWINALQELVYIIAVIHSKNHTISNDFINMNNYRHLNWIEKWEMAYEEWYTREHKPVPKFEEYFQHFVLNSFDIVVAWIVDYMAQRAGAISNVVPDFCGLANRMKNCSFDFRPNVNLQTKWNLSGDDGIVCALRKSDMLQVLDKKFPFNWVLEALDPPDRIKAMAHAFVTCEVLRGCTFPQRNYVVTFGEKYYPNNDYYDDKHQVVRLQNGVECVLKCSDLPKEFKHNKYSLTQVTAEHLKYYAYAHAYMTTENAYDLICSIGGRAFGATDIRTECQPQFAGQYLFEREYQKCEKKEKEYLDEDKDKDNESKFWTFEKKSDLTLTVKMKTFPYLERELY